MGFIPQLIKLIRHKDAEGLSVKMYAVTTTGFTLWVVFGALKHSWPIILSNGAMLILAAAILVLMLRYGQRAPKGR